MEWLVFAWRTHLWVGNQEPRRVPRADIQRMCLRRNYMETIPQFEEPLPKSLGKRLGANLP